jgi:outer membrane protein assembly factor BamB
LVFDSVSGKSLWQQTQKSTGISAVPPALYPLQTISRSERQVELLSVVGSWLTSRDPKTGAELWRWNAVRAVNEGDLPSLTSGGGITIVLPQKSGIIYALKAGGGNVVWQSGTEELSGGGPAPLFFDGDFFMLDDETKTLLRINAKTGQVKWKMTLPGLVKYTDSPIGADGKVYCWNQAGAILIVSALDGGNLGFLPMGDNGQGTTRLSMAIAQGQLFIGTPTRLYCVGKNDLPLGPTGLSNRSNDPRVGQPEGLKRRLPL